MPARDYCLDCGRPAADHHAFVPAVAPEGCTCDPHDWGDPKNIPLICWSFVPFDDMNPDTCGNCEHDEGCHRRSDVD